MAPRKGSRPPEDRAQKRPDGRSAAELEERLTVVLRTGLGDGEDAVVWTDCGDEVVVHAGAARVSREGEALVADIPLETDQTGRAVLVVAFELGEEGTGSVAMTSQLPWGDQRLAQRWGVLVQEAAWAAISARLEEPTERRKVKGAR